jgi:hypothetical protein
MRASENGGNRYELTYIVMATMIPKTRRYLGVVFPDSSHRLPEERRPG